MGRRKKVVKKSEDGIGTRSGAENGRAVVVEAVDLGKETAVERVKSS